MRYSVVGLAPYDLAAGIEFVEQLQDAYGIPFVSSNLLRKKTGQRIFEPYIIRQIGDIKVAIVGLTSVGPDPEANPLIPEVSTLPWQDALSMTLGEIGGAVDMIILLSSFPEQINTEIAHQFKQINIILQSGGSAVNLPPRLAENTLIAQTAGRGKYLGKITVNWTAGGKWLRQDSVDQEPRKREADIDGSGETAGREERTAGEYSNYRNTFMALPTSLPEDPEVRQIISEAKERMYGANRRTVEELRLQDGGKVPASSMTGSQSCRKCHPVQAERWKNTKHARAWETLAAKKQEFNLDCLICHVTLPTYDRETVLSEKLLTTLTPEFYGVSCEACHGPGRRHVQAPEKNKLVRPTTRTCTACHTPEQDDHFDFDRKLKLLGCITAGK